MNANPLILTLSFNKEAADFFTQLRDMYFPPERNFLKAHLTLFHKLPSEELLIYETLADICQGHQPFTLEVAAPYNIGFGVAYKIVSEELLQLHRSLQQQWQALLSPQDKQKLRPHITVQNKVKPATAKETEAFLQATFTPFTITGTGLSLWEYLGGPWRLVQEFPFQSKTSLKATL